jgi:hypothetical protein
MPKASTNSLKVIMQKEVEQKMELKDHGLEGLIQEEAPMQMMVLILEEQVENVMEDLLDDDDYYVDWLKWVGFENEWGIMTTNNSNMLTLFWSKNQAIDPYGVGSYKMMRGNQG